MDRQIFRYTVYPYDRHDYPVELYNLETIYKKINEQCIKDIIEYVSPDPIINVNLIKLMIFKKHKVSINKNYIYQIFWNNRIYIIKHKNKNIHMI